MASIEKVNKSFALTGRVGFQKEDKDKNGNPYYLLTVAGVGFFLPQGLWQEARFLEENQRVTVKGEEAGTTVRNGQRQAVLEVYELIPGGEVEIGRVPTATSHGINGNGTLSKAQPA